MAILSYLRLRTKLAVLLALSVATVLAVAFISATALRTQMEADRVDKLKAVAESATSVLEGLESKVQAGRLSRAEALAVFADYVHSVRFDGDAGYLVLVSDDGTVLLHGLNREVEGRPMSPRDASGTSILGPIMKIVQSGHPDTISYLYPKPGTNVPASKLSYVTRYAPWKANFIVGAFTDDLDALYDAVVARILLIGGGILGATLLLAWLINRDISGSLDRLAKSMAALAAGKLDAAVAGLGRKDEVGRMAAAVEVFQAGLVKADRLTTEREEQRARADREKQQALIKMADTIESETRNAMDSIGQRTAALSTTASEMTSSAKRTGGSAEAASGAAAQALSTAETVASAAEELAASIREISTQVTQSTAVVGRAVAAGDETRQTIETLNAQVERIGVVVDMIREIAGKTNLLALNATIEAARAGDAGKGFAVVAGEVKALATQTTRSTEEITRHIAEVRDATAASVTAVAQIEATISEMNAIASSIAASVEEQGAATSEIARNVAATAEAAKTMNNQIGEVSVEAGETGARAQAVLDTTVHLNEAVKQLRQSVVRVVRNSTAEVDRRAWKRFELRQPCSLQVDGRTYDARLVDLSQAGARVEEAPSIPVGSSGLLTLSELRTPLAFTVLDCADGVIRMRFRADAAAAAEIVDLIGRLHGHAQAA